MHKLAGALLVLATLTACKCRHPASGCRFVAPAPEVISQLAERNPTVRRDAARALRTRLGVPKEAVAPLIQALMTETDKDTHGEMLLTLGHSGDDDALQHILITLELPDTRARSYARDALWAWRVARNLETDPDRPSSFAPRARAPQRARR